MKHLGTFRGGPARNRRALLWTGVTGCPSPDRTDPSVDQYNLQVRKSSVCIGGPRLYNQQRGIVLCIRDIFCIILASSPTREPVVHEGAAVVCRVAEAFSVALEPWQTSWGYCGQSRVALASPGLTGRAVPEPRCSAPACSALGRFII